MSMIFSCFCCIPTVFHRGNKLCTGTKKRKNWPGRFVVAGSDGGKESVSLLQCEQLANELTMVARRAVCLHQQVNLWQDPDCSDLFWNLGTFRLDERLTYLFFPPSLSSASHVTHQTSIFRWRPSSWRPLMWFTPSCRWRCRLVASLPTAPPQIH